MCIQICFPTCVSVNGIFSHFSPQPDHKQKLQDGDVVKVELGAHIDGFVGVVGGTLIVGSMNSDADALRVIQASIVGAHAALHMLRPGVTNTQLTAIVEKVAAQFQVETIKKHCSYQVKR